MIVYGGCIEPGGMELADARWRAPCPHCGKPAWQGHVERLEGGAINAYRTLACEHCGAHDGFDWDYP